MSVEVIKLNSQLADKEADKLEGQFIEEAEIDRLVTADADVYKPNGEVLFKFRKSCLPAEQCSTAFAILRGLRQPITNRHTASQGISINPVRKDGLLSQTNRVTRQSYADFDYTTSAIIGYYDRYSRFPYCRQTAFNINEPKKFGRLIPLFRSIDTIFASEMPERYANQKAAVAATHPDWIISGTAFTTVTVNRNWRTRIHQDAGDLKEGFGVMCVFNAGKYEGCYFAYPKYRIAVDVGTQDLLLDDVHEWHGNTELRGKRGFFERVSCVFYYRENMRKCGTQEEELARVKQRWPGRPMPLYD